MDSAIIIGRAASQQNALSRRSNAWQDECAAITANKARRRRRMSRKRRMLLLAAVMVPAYLGAGGWWLVRTGAVEQTQQAAGDWLFEQTQQAGFVLKTIRIEGLKELSPELVTKAASMQLGDAMLSMSLKEIRQNIEALPEVRDAKVRRQFPDTITITITERVPSAVWQYGGRWQWLDRDGTVLTNQRLMPSATDLRVMGKDAPTHIESLLHMIEEQPNLKPLVASARRIGGRRWDVVLRPGLLIKLPQDKPEAAWEELAQLYETQNLAARAIRVIDMRVEDRLFITPLQPTLPVQQAPAPTPPATDVEGGHDA